MNQCAAAETPRYFMPISAWILQRISGKHVVLLHSLSLCWGHIEESIPLFPAQKARFVLDCQIVSPYSRGSLVITVFVVNTTDSNSDGDSSATQRECELIRVEPVKDSKYRQLFIWDTFSDCLHNFGFRRNLNVIFCKFSKKVNVLCTRNM